MEMEAAVPPELIVAEPVAVEAPIAPHVEGCSRSRSRRSSKPRSRLELLARLTDAIAGNPFRTDGATGPRPPGPSPSFGAAPTASLPMPSPCPTLARRHGPGQRHRAKAPHCGRTMPSAPIRRTTPGREYCVLLFISSACTLSIVIVSAAEQSSFPPRRDFGLLRCARNDGVWSNSAPGFRPRG